MGVLTWGCDSHGCAPYPRGGEQLPAKCGRNGAKDQGRPIPLAARAAGIGSRKDIKQEGLWSKPQAEIKPSKDKDLEHVLNPAWLRLVMLSLQPTVGLGTDSKGR